MPKGRRLGRQPPTPNIDAEKAAQHFTADPASPPETPTTSPDLSRKSSLKPRHQPPFNEFLTSLENDPSIKPVGNGHQFSYRPGLGPEQLSPRSTSSSETAAESSDEDDDDKDEDGDVDVDDLSNSPTVASIRNVPLARVAAILGNQSPLPRPTVSQDTDDEADEEEDVDANEEDDIDDEGNEEEDGMDDEEEDGEDGDEVESSRKHRRSSGMRRRRTRTLPSKRCSTVLDVIVEELDIEEMDPADSDWDTSSIIQPYDITEPPKSFSGPLYKELDRCMMDDLKNLNCSAEASSDDGILDAVNDDNDSEEDDDDLDMEMEAFYKRQAEIKRIRRVSMSSSFGKRTHSELSDSDDEYGPLDVHEVGSSAHRLRKRLHRTSILFNDPPEQIEELEEPDSSEDEKVAVKSLAMELPYWTMEIMEVDTTES